MTQRLLLVVRALALLVGAAVAAHLPQTPLQVLVVVLVGAAMLVPFVARLAGSLARALAAVWHGPADAGRAAEVADVVVPAAPGTPGTALARAPSRLACVLA